MNTTRFAEPMHVLKRQELNRQQNLEAALRKDKQGQSGKISAAEKL